MIQELALLCLQLLQTPPLPPPQDDLQNAFRLELGYARVSGFTQVRENSDEGTRLPLHDLGVRDAEVASLEYDRNLGDESRLRLRLRWFYVAGSARFDDEIRFNGVHYVAGSKVDTLAELGDVSLRWEQELFPIGDAGRVSLLVGTSLTYLNLKVHGTQAAGSTRMEQKEAFFKQMLPLPSLGLRVDYPLKDGSRLWAEAFGFRVLHWSTLRSEGGTIFLSQDQLEATIGWSKQLSKMWTLDLGLRYEFLSIEQTSHEDGNQFLLRSFGPFIALQLRF